MNVLILQASPRAKGNTAWMADEYKNAAEAAGHNVTLVNVAHKHIAGCLARECVRSFLPMTMHGNTCRQREF